MTELRTAPQPESKSPSRRALLAGALGGLGALAATAIGRPQVAEGHDADDVLLGGSNLANSTTTIETPAGVIALSGFAHGSGVGLYGQSDSLRGVWGNCGSGSGVLGESNSGAGVSGSSFEGNGLFGQSSSASASGVYSENNDRGYGVAGRSNAHGLGVNGVFAAATLGENTADGIGVWARSQSGVGLYADAIDISTAVALKTRGVTQFGRSGTATIQAGHASFTKTGIRIDPASLVLATLQQDRSGIFVRSAVPNPSGDSFTIHLNKAVGSDTKVGWFIVN